MSTFERLLEVARRKSEFDKQNDWYKGSETYLTAIRSELDEVTEEISRKRAGHLEDELGDVLWGYLNAVLSLENEMAIQLDSVIERAYRKYSQRVDGIEAGQSWRDIKEQQKRLLDQEPNA